MATETETESVELGVSQVRLMRLRTGAGVRRVARGTAQPAQQARPVVLDADEQALLDAIERTWSWGRDEPVRQVAEPVGGFVW